LCRTNYSDGLVIATLRIGSLSIEIGAVAMVAMCEGEEDEDNQNCYSLYSHKILYIKKE
jgi:hypothetical protein